VWAEHIMEATELIKLCLWPTYSLFWDLRNLEMSELSLLYSLLGNVIALVRAAGRYLPPYRGTQVYYNKQYHKIKWHLTYTYSWSLLFLISLIYVTITNSMELSLSWEAAICEDTQEFPTHFMEPEGSLSSSQKPSTGPYPDSDQSIPYYPSDLSRIHFNVIHPPMSRSS
jgi:hypothetical protein